MKTKLLALGSLLAALCASIPAIAPVLPALGLGGVPVAVITELRPYFLMFGGALLAVPFYFTHRKRDSEAQPRELRTGRADRVLVYLTAVILATAALLPGQHVSDSANSLGHRADATYQILDSNLEPLRQQFNQDADKPRVLMLLSPT